MGSDAFLTGKEIKDRQESPTEKIFKEGTFDEQHLEKIAKDHQVMYDLRLGEHVFLSQKDRPITLTAQNPYVIIRPGEFGLLTTEEVVTVPNTLIGFISLRFAYAKRGLINISGFHVDPGYSGRLIFSVYNAGPNDIGLKRFDRVFMVLFAPLQSPFVGEREPGYDDIPIDMIGPLKGNPISPRQLEKRIDSLNNRLRILEALVAATLATFLSLVAAGIVK